MALFNGCDDMGHILFHKDQNQAMRFRVNDKSAFSKTNIHAFFLNLKVSYDSDS